MSGNIMTHYGGTILGMIGGDCVALASDKRVGSGYETLAQNYCKLSEPNSNVIVGIVGFAPDAQMFHKDLYAASEMFQLENERELNSSETISLISSILYDHRFGPLYVQPITIGFDTLEDGSKKPVCAGHDSIGAPAISDWVADGTGAEFLMGTAEKFYKKNMTEEELLDVVSKTFESGVNRDAYSGWGIEVWILRSNGEIVKKDIACRQD